MKKFLIIIFLAQFWLYTAYATEAPEKQLSNPQVSQATNSRATSMLEIAQNNKITQKSNACDQCESNRTACYNSGGSSIVCENEYDKCVLKNCTD